jgi:hypothetical protein
MRAIVCHYVTNTVRAQGMAACDGLVTLPCIYFTLCVRRAWRRATASSPSRPPTPCRPCSASAPPDSPSAIPLPVYLLYTVLSRYTDTCDALQALQRLRSAGQATP